LDKINWFESLGSYINKENDGIKERSNTLEQRED